MKLFVTIRRVIKTAFQNLFRNAWLGIATIVVLVMALTSINILVGVNALLQNAIRLVEDKVDVTVFFKEDANAALVAQARFFIADLPQVADAKLLTAEESLEAFKERHQGEPEVLDALNELDGNPLGATMRIKARNPADYPFIIETLKNPQFASAIEARTYDDHATTIENVRRVSENARKIGTALIVIFVLIGILIVFNTIRVAIYTQREEIGIMRLVGASSTYVRAPFVLQGILLATFAMMITAVFIYFGISWIEPALIAIYDGADPGIASYFLSHWPQLLLIQGGGLAILIGITSWLAAGKYLRR